MPDNQNNYDDIIETEAWDIEEETKKNNTVNLKFFFENRIITVPIIIIIAAAVFSMIVWSISVQSTATADFFTDNISFALRFVLTSLTYHIPFSAAEFIIYISIPAAIYLLAGFIRKIINAKNDKIVAALRGLVKCIAFVCAIIFVFIFTFSICYSATPVNKKMGFERRLISSHDLADAMQVLIKNANAAAQNIEHIYLTGSTAMPYNLDELNKKLNKAYTELLDRHNITRQIKARVKPVIWSTQLSKMHITGIYSPFTGEANINIDFPDFNLPFTAAHEMAHLMGIAREDEANFVAFLVCLYSGDNYIKYSGFLNMIRYLQNPLYQADEDKYFEVMYELDPIIAKELTAYREFFNKYRDTRISRVASTVNDTYLKTQKQEAGEKSYGLVVDLATIYILEFFTSYE